MGIFLETQRLVLKTPELSDLDDLIALGTAPDVMRYINDGLIQTPEKIHEHLIKRFGRDSDEKDHSMSFFKTNFC